MKQDPKRITIDYKIRQHQNQKLIFKINQSNNHTLVLGQNDLDNQIRNCFFIDGGGTKGIYGLGVFKYLFEENPYVDLNDINLFGGTSVGSYLAAALSFGCNKDDILEISKQIDLSKLTDGKYLFVKTIFRFFTQGYMYDYDGRKSIIGQILEYKIKTIKEHLKISSEQIFTYEDLTFKHLRDLIILFPNIYRHLLINTVDLSRGTQIFMTSMEEKWDNIKIVDALLASSSIPGVFKLMTMRYNPITDRYGYDKSDNSTLNTFADGGTSNNNPYEYFLINNNFTGYQIWMLKFVKQPAYVKIDGTISLFNELLEFWICGKNQIVMEILEEKYNVNVINLNLTAGTLDIYTQEQIQEIINKIYQECKNGDFFNSNIIN